MENIHRVNNIVCIRRNVTLACCASLMKTFSLATVKDTSLIVLTALKLDRCEIIMNGLIYDFINVYLHVYECMMHGCRSSIEVACIHCADTLRIYSMKIYSTEKKACCWIKRLCCCMVR